MGNVLQLRGLGIGVGAPKICVPLAGEDMQALLKAAARAATAKAEMVEWRADFFEEKLQAPQIATALRMLRATMGEVPIIFTMRSGKEGGRLPLTKKEYHRLCLAAIEAGGADLMDIELSCGVKAAQQLAQQAKAAGMKVVLSAHLLHETPPAEDMLAMLCQMRKLGADLPKIAVTPLAPADVLALFSAAQAYSQQQGGPFIAIAMGKLGMVSRVAAGLFGSAVTFASLEKATAPGQLPVAQMADMLKQLYGE